MLACLPLRAQDCAGVLQYGADRATSHYLPVYIHTDGVCPDDTLQLVAVRDEDKIYLTGMPSECRTPRCEYIIRKSYYDVLFADSTTIRYYEPYLTNYSSGELFIMLKGRVVTRTFHPKTYKAKCRYTYAKAELLEKMLHTPIVAIQACHATPRTEWEEKPYKAEYTPGSRLQLSPQTAARLMLALQCLAARVQ